MPLRLPVGSHFNLLGGRVALEAGLVDLHRVIRLAVKMMLMSIRAASPSRGYAFQSPLSKSRCQCTRSQKSRPLVRATASCVLVSLRDDDSQAGLVDPHLAVRLVVKMGQLWPEQELAVLCARLRISQSIFANMVARRTSILGTSWVRTAGAC